MTMLYLVSPSTPMLRDLIKAGRFGAITTPATRYRSGRHDKETLNGLPACHKAHPGKNCQRTAPGGYCPPRVCWCGSCPWWSPTSYTPASETILDRKARESGRRASGAQRRRASS